MIGRRRMRKPCVLAFFCLLFLLSGIHLAAAEQVVFDDAGLFTAEERENLAAQAEALGKEHGMNFVAVTTDDADGLSTEEYADSFYENHGFVENGKKGGILILIDMDHRELYICTNKDMIYYMTDAWIEETLDVGYDEVTQERYAQAVQAMFAQVDEIIGQGLDNSHYMIDRETGEITRYHGWSAAELITVFLMPLMIAGGVCFAVAWRYGRVPKYEYAVGENADIHFRRRNDMLTDQFVTRRRIPRNPPPGSGGSGSHGGGGSTIHTSSGGNSFGGGGRKF